jgi:hypothetical protein
MIYAYRTINIINGNYYFGIHKSVTGNIDNYIGCGIRRQSDARLNNRFHNAVRKYGYENFKVTVIMFFSCYEDALSWEREFLTKEVVADSRCYNSKLGGKGGGYIWSDERKKYHKENNTYKKSDDMKNKLRQSAINRFSKECGTFQGKKHTIETKKRLSESRKGVISKNKNKKLNLTEGQRILKRDLFLKNAHSRAVEVNRKFSIEVEEEIKSRYSGARGEKTSLAKEYNCSISLITKLVGKSFKHKKYES